MRLLWLTENYFPNRGGMAQSCDRITYHLRQKGLWIDIIHFVKRKNMVPKELLNGTYQPVFVETDIAHDLNVLWKDLAHRIRPDLIVGFGGSITMLAAPIFAQWMERPLVTLIRGNDFDAGVFTPRKREVLLYALEKSAAIATVSQDKATKINRLIDGKKAVFIANGIETNSWIALPSDMQQAQKWRTNEVSINKKVIGCFGHLKVKKGLPFFIKSLIKSKLSANIHLLLIGELESSIQELLSETDLSFSLLPFLDRHELIPYYLACDVVAIPSFYDGMPNVLLEAGAMGIPVLAAKTDGMADVLSGDFEDFLFEVNEEEALITVIEKVVEMSKADLEKVGMNLKRKTINEYSQNLETERYVSLFSKVKRGLGLPT